MITQTYNLNLVPNKVPVSVDCSQYDALSRTITFNIYDGALLKDVTGATATVRGTKKDNTGFEYPCTVSGSTVSFVIQDQMTVFCGKVPCEIRLADNGILGSCNFMLNVEPTPLDPNVTISETDLPLLEEAEQNAIRAEQAADEAESVLSSAVKSVNNTLPDANGNVTIQTGSTLTAGTGINITNDVITNTIFNANLNQKNGIDLNTITEGGVYYVYNGSTALNFPSGASGALVVIKDSSAYSRQIYYRHGTLNSADQYWYSRLVNSSTQEASDWVQFYNSKTLTGGTGIEIANGVINDQFIYKPGDTVTISTPSTAPICMGGYIGSSGTALNLTFSFGRGISATSISATTLRISAYNATERLITASATNDLITGSVYSCTLTLNTETSTVTVHIVKNDGTTFGTNATSITGALSSGTFVFS